MSIIKIIKLQGGIDMKRYSFVFIVIGIIYLAVLFCPFKNKTEVRPNVTSLSEKLIRFHVIANSDSTKDQSLKLKVRDDILNYISPLLSKEQSLSKARDTLVKEESNIKNLATKTVLKNGYDYSVKVMLSHENFPVKTYGNITLPQGNYEAFRIIIGEGQGRNWWCVMFPPLCFIDVTTGEASFKKADKAMEKNLTEKEYKSILNTTTVNGQKVQLKFKIFEVFQNLINRKNAT